MRMEHYPKNINLKANSEPMKLAETVLHTENKSVYKRDILQSKTGNVYWTLKFEQRYKMFIYVYTLSPNDCC